MTDRERSSAWPGFEAEAMPHLDSLFRIAMWFERNRDEAEDLVQDTLRQALESFHRYKPGTNCRAWLMTILHHVRSNRLRAKGRSPLVSDPEGQLAGAIPFVPAVPEELTDEDMLTALKQIPQQFQEVLLLSDVEELSYKDIAATLGVPIGTVMSRLHRGRALLRQTLARSGRHTSSSSEGKRA